MGRQKLIAGNWKMNGSHEFVENLINSIQKDLENSSAEVVVAPPSLYLSQADALLDRSQIQLAAQNVSEKSHGAYTGEISVPMLKDFLVKFVLVGHSERRALYHETNDVVAEKVRACLSGGLTPILCVGETLEERQQAVTLDVCSAQIDAVINADGIEAFADIVIAYEPRWAIGTGLSATAEQAQEVHQFIREKISAIDVEIGDAIRILYGGSVMSSNCSALFAMPDIDGALIGGASLKSEEFVKIIKSAG